ncbi:MAG: LUD domain-containing protein [Ignavibacteriaceae bacterium]
MIKPRDVANKSNPDNLRKALKMSLDIESAAVKRNTKTFNTNHYTATGNINDYELLKDNARKLKEYSIENLPELLRKLENSVIANGGHFYLAKDAKDAREYILKICREHNAELIVKGKSITSEEIKLNRTLEAAGIEVAETDLAEFILQYSGEQPSHIVGPAIHQSRERISKLFKEKFNPDFPLETGEELTKFARAKLREKFLSADLGITGANFIAADSGSIALVESEGNIRLCYTLPPVHIALAGVEKVLPSLKDLSIFLELLAPSGTGQPLTSYTSVIRPPLNLPLFPFNSKKTGKREFHLVLIDNGRLKMRSDPVMREALYCIRCGACLNACANFQSVGGHAFGGETYSGGIGGTWEAGTGMLENARFSELCTGCSRCAPQCPVKIDIPWLNEVLHQRLNEKEKSKYSFIFQVFLPADSKSESASLQKLFLGNFHHFAKLGSRFPAISNTIQSSKPVKILMDKYLGISRQRKLPVFAKKTLIEQSKNIKELSGLGENIAGKVLLFADIYTNYLYPSRGIDVIKLFKAFGINLIPGKVIPDGRAALSQGLINAAAKRAEKTSQYLMLWIEKGYSIIVTEPSVLAMFRRDYNHFIKDKDQFLKIKAHCYEPLEYLHKIILKEDFDFSRIFDLNKLPADIKLFYHSHCQQKTIGAAEPTVIVLKKIGFDIEISNVECCGMAGSFGYKKDYYEVSMKDAEDLFDQIKSAGEKNNILVLASGVSCKDQISEGLGIEVIHPVELLTRILIS